MLLEEIGLTSNCDLDGIKIAEVVSNEDPKCQERILIRVIGVHNMNNKSKDNAIWANHCAPVRSASGDLPEPEEFVYVLFPEKRNPMSCLWLGFVRSSFQENTKEGEKDPTSLTFDPPEYIPLGEALTAEEINEEESLENEFTEE